MEAERIYETSIYLNDTTQRYTPDSFNLLIQ
jgi:hypothetical protein